MALSYINTKIEQLINIFLWLYYMEITKLINYKQISLYDSYI